MSRVVRRYLVQVPVRTYAIDMFAKDIAELRLMILALLGTERLPKGTNVWRHATDCEYFED